MTSAPSDLKLVGLVGYKGSGKTFTADHLQQFGFEKLHLAWPLKNTVKQLFKFTDNQLYGDLREIVDTRYNMSPRQILQYLGTDIIRANWPNLLIDSLLDHIVYNGLTRVSIHDVRFPNEAEGIRAHGGKIIRVVKANSSNEDYHASEVEHLKIKEDFKVVAPEGSLNFLFKQVESYLKDMGWV